MFICTVHKQDSAGYFDGRSACKSICLIQFDLIAIDGFIKFANISKFCSRLMGSLNLME